MPHRELEDTLIMSEVFAKDERLSTKRSERGLIDNLGLFDTFSRWRGDQYSRTISDNLILSDSRTRYNTGRYYRSFSDVLCIEDTISPRHSDHFYRSICDTLTLSDEKQIYHGNRKYRFLNDRLLLTEERERRFELFVTGGTGDGAYKHGARVPISVTLVGDERFLAWAGEEQYIEDIYALSTYVNMPSETVRIEAIKGDVSLTDILKLGGRVSAARLDLVMEQGATFERNIYYKDSDNNPIDISGWTAAMQIRQYKDSTDALLTLTSSAGNIIMAGPTGHLEIHIPATDMDDLTFSWGYYDLELYPGGDMTRAFRLLEGRVKLTKEVTR